MKLGKLDFESVENKFNLVGGATEAYLKQHKLDNVLVAEIDPVLADTAAFCDRYEISPEISANCVIVEAKRAGRVWYAACLILATMRADINGIVRKQLDARKVSFAPMGKAVAMTDMEYGGIGPIGLPSDCRLLIDERVASTDYVVIGSGIRGSKLVVPGKTLGSLQNSQVLNLVK